MKEIAIIKKDDYIEAQTKKGGSWKMLLQAQEDGMEVIRFFLAKGSTGELVSMLQDNGTEMFYVIEGELCIKTSSGPHYAREDDFFLFSQEHSYTTYEAMKDTRLLFVSNGSIFRDLDKVVQARDKMLDDIQLYDGYTGDHCRRVEDLCAEIARFLGYSYKEARNIMTAAKCHDVGKVKIPREILMKPGKLTPEEYELIKEHSKYSRDMIALLVNEEIADIVYAHHERPDGKGYPRGLKGDEISLEARIIAVADAFDAMTHDRGYNKVRSEEGAMEELRRCQGTQFDEKCVEALGRYLMEIGHLPEEQNN